MCNITTTYTRFILLIVTLNITRAIGNYLIEFKAKFHLLENYNIWLLSVNDLGAKLPVAMYARALRQEAAAPFCSSTSIAQG